MDKFFKAAQMITGTGVGQMLSPGNPFRAICVGRPEESTPNYVLGSGIEFYPGLILTASHVVEEFMRLYDELHFSEMGERRLRNPRDHCAFTAGKYTSKGTLFCASIQSVETTFSWSQGEDLKVGFSETSKVQNAGRVTSMISAELAVIQVLEEGIANPIMIDMRPPLVGTEIVAAGFPGGNVDVERLQVLMPATILHGHITEVHPSGGETSTTFPRFVTDVDFPAGMSGGPVFRKDNGSLTGIVSRGGLGRGTSALLWNLAVHNLPCGNTLKGYKSAGKFDAIGIDFVTLKDGRPIYDSRGPL